MKKKVNVAELKRKFAEFLGRVAYAGERFLIERNGTPVAAIVNVEDFNYIENHRPGSKRQGLMTVVGLWEDEEELDQIIGDIYQGRNNSKDREVDLD